MTGDVAAAGQSAAVFHMRLVQAKIASGEYAVESVSCFCGSTDSKPVTTHDRYGFDYRMVLCRSCGILYTNPRMTAEAYRLFYENEYRLIYDDGLDAEEEFLRGTKCGKHLADYFLDYGIQPRVVFDVGCNVGAWLKHFQDIGATVYGVDYNAKNASYGRDHGIPVLDGGLEGLEATGRHADLIVLNHVMEHFLDIPAQMARIRNLLTDDGYLYVGVPGLYCQSLEHLWQNAHTYQFTADTLQYAMECCGFEEFYLDEEICSVWKKASKVREKHMITPQAAMYVDNFLHGDRKLIPPIRAISKFKVKDRTAWITAAVKSGTPDIDTLGHVPVGTEAMIIAGGPSVDGQMKAMRKLHADGVKIIAIERMYPWCMKHGLVPDYVVVLDASDDVLEGFCALSRTTMHLVGSQCQPTVMEALKGYLVAMFYTAQHGIDWRDIWYKEGMGDATLVNAGGSVSLCAMSLAMTLGIQTLHVFGFDCHVGSGVYAMGIVGVGDQKRTFTLDVKDRSFVTTTGYYAFAQQFFQLWRFGKDLGLLKRVVVYGDSLVSAMAKDAENISRTSDTMMMTATSKELQA